MATSKEPGTDPYASEPIDRDYFLQKPKPLPSDPHLRSLVSQVQKDGFVVIPNAFSAADALAAKAEVDRLHGTAPRTGRDAFDGFQTNRIFALLAKTRAFDKFCLLPTVTALNQFFLGDDHLIYIMETITIQPGERAQVLHHDDVVSHLPRPRPPLTAATMIVLDDYTARNGATRVIPGSHLWDSERLGEESEAVPVVCPRGSVIYFLGTTWHSGGANRSESPRYAATIQYCRPFIRPLENLMLSVDPRRVLSGEIPRPIVDMMGYRSAVPFVGYGECFPPCLSALGLRVLWVISGETRLTDSCSGRSQSPQSKPATDPVASGAGSVRLAHFCKGGGGKGEQGPSQVVVVSKGSRAFLRCGCMGGGRGWACGDSRLVILGKHKGFNRLALPHLPRLRLLNSVRQKTASSP